MARTGPASRRLLGEAGVTDSGVTEDDSPEGWVNLSTAIAALRRDLTAALLDGEKKLVRFKVEPIELTLEAGVTKSGKGEAGVKWHILTLGGEKSKEKTVTQTLVLRLEPVFYDDEGNPRADQLVSGPDIYAQFPESPSQPDRS
jgi:hypothetical protein